MNGIRSVAGTRRLLVVRIGDQIVVKRLHENARDTTVDHLGFGLEFPRRRDRPALCIATATDPGSTPRGRGRPSVRKLDPW